MIAHVLQELEAQYIAILTETRLVYGFTAVSNHHDGVVTLGSIPCKTLDEAVRRSLFANYARLVPKPLY